MLLGVLFVVMLPTMLGAVRKKVPVIGGLIAFFIDNIFRVLGSQLTKMVSRTEADLKSKVAKKAGALDIKVENLVDQAAERGMVVLEDVGKRSGKIVDSTLRILSIPIRIIAYVLGVISALIAWLFI